MAVSASNGRPISRNPETGACAGRFVEPRSAGRNPSISSFAPSRGPDRPNGPADQFAAAPEHGDRMFFRPLFAQQRFLCLSARMPERIPIATDPVPHCARRKRGRHNGPGPGPCCRRRRECDCRRRFAGAKSSPSFLGDADEREIRRAAADVADQHGVADAEFLAPGVAHVGQPRIQRRLRLFEQDQICGRPADYRRLAGQFAGTGIKRAGTVSTTCCSAIGASGKRRRPRRDKMLQISPRRLDRRNLRHVCRCVPRKDRLMPIDPAVRQPRLGPGDRAHRHLGRLSHRHRADGIVLPAPHGRSNAPPAVPARCPGTRTTAASHSAPPSRPQQAAEPAEMETAPPVPHQRRAAYTPARCWWCRDRFRLRILG